MAETRRRLGAVAETLGLPRPSYESVRQLVRAHRRSRRRRSEAEIILDLALYTGPPDKLVADLLSSDG